MNSRLRADRGGMEMLSREYRATRIREMRDLTNVAVKRTPPSIKDIMKWGSTIGDDLEFLPFHPEYFVKGDIPRDYLEFKHE